MTHLFSENSRRILLIEPDYRNKYPPLGLMKISSYHKQRGDQVTFYKGCSSELRNQKWDRIYISTLFTFHWIKTLKTINYYINSVVNTTDIFVGGILATLHTNDIRKLFPVTVVRGLLNEKGKIGYDDDDIIDELTPDYSIIDLNQNRQIRYNYATKDSYFVHATRGCKNKCSFCAVPVLEPEFYNSNSILRQVTRVREIYKEKRNLIVMDNNILASDCFTKIIDEIKAAGFSKNAKLQVFKNGRHIKLNRTVDFNQGVEAKRLTPEKMKLISEIGIKPLRIAFDDIKLKELYIEKVRLAAQYGIRVLSNYILYNYKDTPEDFYERLRINIELTEEFGKSGYPTRIWSFPMRYSPILDVDGFWKGRKYVGIHWHKKYIRGIQCILLATHGVVGPRKKFFNKAFGRNFDEFKSIITAPEIYIIWREKNKNKKRYLEKKIESLTENQQEELTDIILKNDFRDLESLTTDRELQRILKVYKRRK